MKIIVSGSRNFTDYNYLMNKLDHLIEAHSYQNIEIVTGDAKGVDTLAVQYASERGYELRIYPADWERYGRGAGPHRNYAMANYAQNSGILSWPFLL